MIQDEGVTACTCGVASDFEPPDAVADPACPKHAVVLRNAEAPLDSIPLPWKATSPHSDRVRDAAARKASVTREDAAMSDTGCTADTQLVYGTWRVLVNDDGEPYAVDNGTSRLGVDTDGNVERRRSSNASTYEQLDMVGRAGYNAGLQAARDALPAPLVLDRVTPEPAECSCRGYADEPTCARHGVGKPPSAPDARDSWETPNESNPSQPAPLAKDEAASLPSANLVKAAEAVVESWARADRADVFRVHIARLEGALIDELAKLDEADEAVLATMVRPECVGDRDRAGTLLCSITDWDLDRTGGYARALADIENAFALADIEDAFADVRRETIQACAAWLDTQLEANGAFKGFVDGADMIEAMTKKGGEP